MTDDVAEIKRRLNIVDLVGAYLPLKKAGVGWRGLCPFHQEKTPSFHVNPERQIFKCFGCNEAGDVIDFVMKMEHLTFPEALQLLADRVGVVLDRRKTAAQYAHEKDVKSRIFALNRIAAEVFHRILLHPIQGQAAREYLKSRGLTEATIQDFHLGFAPPTFNRSEPTILEEFLTKRGFTPSERRQAGSPERFRNRLIFPLWDNLGNVVGFTGRAMDPADQPKYLNTPETPIFKKSRLLYPLHQAREAIKTTDRVILVEGQMDVLLAHQLGTKEVVATSGTALTVDHLTILGRYTSHIVFAFDTDAAGVEATRKAILLAYELELEPAVVTLPAPYKDLGELALEKPDQWPKVLTQARPAFAWQLELALAAYGTETASAKKTIARLTLPILARMRDPIEQTHWLQQLAKTIRVSETTIHDALERLGRHQSGQKRPKVEDDAPSSQTTKRATPAETFLGLVIAFPEHLDDVISRIELDLFSGEERAGRLAKTLLGWYNASGTTERAQVLHAVTARLDRADGMFLVGLISDIEARLSGSEPTVVRSEIEESLARLLSARRTALKEAIAEKIAAAERLGDRAAVKKLLADFQKMLQKKA